MEREEWREEGGGRGDEPLEARLRMKGGFPSAIVSSRGVRVALRLVRLVDLLGIRFARSCLRRASSRPLGNVTGGSLVAYDPGVCNIQKSNGKRGSQRPEVWVCRASSACSRTISAGQKTRLGGQWKKKKFTVSSVSLGEGPTCSPAPWTPVSVWLLHCERPRRLTPYTSRTY